MKKLLIAKFILILLFTSCVSKKKYAELEAKQKETQDQLNSATVKLNKCLSDANASEERLKGLQDRLDDMKQINKDFAVLSAQGASNLEKSLESLKEKDLKITKLQDALSKKDSVTLALVTSLKREVGLNDPDIEVNVEKGVVFISIADKLLFKSGSYDVSSKAEEVLKKVAKVINSKPDFEAMVEAHTDNVPYSSGVLLDNWDLSVKRATSVIRVLEKLNVNSKQLIAAGRSYHVPLADNNSAENRSKNRRTRILVLPKIDQFYKMIEDEMKTLSSKK